MSNEVVPRTVDQQVILPEELVRQNITMIVAREPNAISYDPTTDEGEMVSLRCAVEQGIPAAARDGYRGTVIHWGVAPFGYPNQKTGEIEWAKTLALIM